MTEGPHAARIASLTGDSARASMLHAPLDGRASSATGPGAVAGIGKRLPTRGEAAFAAAFGG